MLTALNWYAKGRSLQRNGENAEFLTETREYGNKSFLVRTHEHRKHTKNNGFHAKRKAATALPEGGEAVKKLVGHDAHRPQVDRGIVGYVADQLRREIRLSRRKKNSDKNNDSDNNKNTRGNYKSRRAARACPDSCACARCIILAASSRGPELRNLLDVAEEEAYVTENKSAIRGDPVDTTTRRQQVDIAPKPNKRMIDTAVSVPRKHGVTRGPRS